MSAEVISFEKFFEIIGKTNRIEFNDVIVELLNATRVDISMNEA